MPQMGHYAALWRLNPDADWSYVRKNRRPVLFPTRSQALAAAKDCVRRMINPPLRVSRADESVGRSLVAEAREARLKAQSEGQRKAFGGVVVRGNLVRAENRGKARR